MDELKAQEIKTEIDLKEVFFYILYRWYLVALVAILLAVGAWAYSSYVITPMYTSTTSIYVINQREDNQQINYTDTMTALQFLADYKELIVARPVLEKAINKAGAEMTASQLDSCIKVSNTEDTRVINISVSDESPEMAKKLADAVRVSSAEFLEKTIEVDAVKTVSEASTPINPSSPSITKWTLMGGLIGAFLVIVILLILFISDNTIKTSDDVNKYLGWSTLALVPLNQHKNGKNNGYGSYGYGDYSKKDKKSDKKSEQ